jgi:hypothetical protein
MSRAQCALGAEELFCASVGVASLVMIMIADVCPHALRDGSSILELNITLYQALLSTGAICEQRA